MRTLLERWWFASGSGQDAHRHVGRSQRAPDSPQLVGGYLRQPVFRPDRPDLTDGGISRQIGIGYQRLGLGIVGGTFS